MTAMEEIFLNNNIGDIKQMDYNNFLNIRKSIIEKEFSRMNDMQKKAVFRIKGPLLILAGAGSGKTTVLLIEFQICSNTAMLTIRKNLQGLRMSTMLN